MTILELSNFMRSRKRTELERLREKATLDYKLGDLIGKSIARIYNSSNKYPEISEIYPTLFDSEEIQAQKQEKQAELSALRFKQFAQSFNSKFNKEEAKEK